MRVVWLKKASRGLSKMPAHDRDALVGKVEHYAATGEGDVRQLVGSPEHRLRHGDWRAIFVIEGDMIVVRIAHRREVYR